MKPLATLTETQFENMTLDLVSAQGLKNAVWRTPGRDGGRDIQGDWSLDDLSGYSRTESWYVECKQYTGTVSWPTVWEKIAYAQSNSADVLLLVTTSTLSPQAIDEVNKWNLARKSPVIRFWGAHDLADLLALQPSIQIKYGLSTDPKTHVALAILPLTNVLVRYANSASGAAAVAAHGQLTGDVIQALAELLSFKIEVAERFGSWRGDPFRAAMDDYPWLKGASAVEAAKLDRYSARAIFAMLAQFAKTDIGVAAGATPDEIVIRDIQDLPTSLEADLKVAAAFGPLQLTIDAQISTLRLRNGI